MRPLHTLRGTMLAVALAGGAAYGTASAPGGSGTGIVPPASTLAQFGAGGHVFGFGPREMYVTNAGYALRVEFSGARAVAPQTDRPAAGGARRGLPPLARVTYPDLWSGITLTYEAVPDGLARSTYRLEAGANPAAIRLAYNATPTLNADGTLTLAYAAGQMTESAPVAWQEVDGRRVNVAVAFALIEAEGSSPGAEIGFALGAYDRSRPLFIDPTLTWNTFLGRHGRSDGGSAIAVDGSGNVYVAGISTGTWGTPIRAFSGFDREDAFVAKLSPGGALTWHTFLGSNDADSGRGIAVDGNGDVYVVGESRATWDTPLQAYSGGFSDAFVAKLSASGTLTWHTFLGSTSTDSAYGIAVDGSGDVYVAGISLDTWGAPVRAHSGGADAFAAKLSPSGGLTWNTFLGGNDYEYGSAIAVDGSGDVYVAGISLDTWGAPVRAHSGGADAFAAKLSPSGGLTWNTFLGGGEDDLGMGIAVDGSGNALVVGYSYAVWGTPVRGHAGSRDAFVAKLDASGNLAWNTFLGGAEIDGALATTADGSGNAYVVGYSGTAWGTPVRGYRGDYDGFTAKLSASGGLIWNTFLGSSEYDHAAGIAVNDSGEGFVTGWSDATWGAPVQAHSGAGGDVFIARIGASVPPPAACPASPAGGCFTSGKGMVALRDASVDSRDRFLWKFEKGPALVQGDFDDPAGTTSYALCLYDDGALAMQVQVGPSATLWTPVSDRGWRYRDVAGAQDGTTMAKLLGGKAGRSKARMTGKGIGVPLPAPASGTRFLAATVSVQAQLHASTGTCYETTFVPAQVIENDAARFKAGF